MQLKVEAELRVALSHDRQTRCVKSAEFPILMKPVLADTLCGSVTLQTGLTAAASVQSGDLLLT